MRTGAGKQYRPSFDNLEDRCVPSEIPATALLGEVMRAGRVAETGRPPRAQGRSLTLGVVTDRPVDVDRPGVPPPPFHADPAGMFTIVAYHHP